MKAIREQLKLLPFVFAFLLLVLGNTFVPSLTWGAIAVVCFVLALLCLVQDRRLALVGRRVQGVVVDHRMEEDCFFPVIEFQDRDGHTRRESTSVGRGVKTPPVGSQVVV